MMEKNSKIYIAGINGMVGSAIKRQLDVWGYTNVLGHSRRDLNLTDQISVDNMFAHEKPEYVIIAAAKVGGIHANNTYPAEFIYSNICIQNNLIHSSYAHDVKKLLFLGSSCIYPKYSDQPIKESALLTGELEPTNEPYAIAKIAGIKMCQAYNKQYGTNFISCMPTNLYGPNDNYDLESSHVLPALIRKIHEAKVKNDKKVTLWGTGRPLREFLYVNDLADACVFLMNNYDCYTNNEIINVGSGEETSVYDLALLIGHIIGYKGLIDFDSSKPDGTPRKLLDSTKINKLGWYACVRLEPGIRAAYAYYLKTFEPEEKLKVNYYSYKRSSECDHPKIDICVKCIKEGYD